MKDHSTDACRRLEGKTALVTGAARGIGLAIATRLLGEGASVALSDIDASALEKVAAGLSDAGKMMALGHDIADDESTYHVVRQIEERFGGLDILVNNGAILDCSPFVTLERGRLSEVLRVNLEGALLCTMAAVPLMARSRGGAILNIASIMGMLGSRDSIPYSTAKGGLVNMTRCLACDLAENGIRVNAIAPGFIDTRMALMPDGSHEHHTEEFRRFYIEAGRIPARRPGKPADIAGPAAFLVSDDATYVTGQILLVDGGVSATF